MGTINYGSNNYINIGVNVNDYDECEGFEKELFIDDLHFEIKSILDNYYFYYYHVTIEPGYYEGFYINIENNFPVCFDDSNEKREAQKEITQLKRFLLECIAAGLVKYSPGWCTGYSTEEETIKAIKEAVKELRQEVRDTPTYKKYVA